MKHAYVFFAALALCLASCKEDKKHIITTTPDTINTDTTAGPLDSIALREAWIKYATPGDQHKMLADETGTWDIEMTVYTENAREEKGTGIADIKMVLGGRYQQAMYNGTMNGMPFEGISTVAFNNTTGQYTSTWIDNMGSGMMVVKGPYDENTKVINFKGDMNDPYDGQKITVRQVYAFVNENSRKMELFETKNGKERKSMEMLMTRI